MTGSSMPKARAYNVRWDNKAVRAEDIIGSKEPYRIVNYFTLAMSRG